MLRQLGMTSNTRELRYELESFRHYHPPRGFLRRDLKVRVSGRRLLKIASRLFSAEAARKARSLKITPSPEIFAQVQSGTKADQIPSGITATTPETLSPKVNVSGENLSAPEGSKT